MSKSLQDPAQKHLPIDLFLLSKVLLLLWATFRIWQLCGVGEICEALPGLEQAHTKPRGSWLTGGKAQPERRQWTTGPGPCLGEERGKKLHSSNFPSLKELVKQRSYGVLKMTSACCFLVNNEGGVSLRSRGLLLATQRHNHSQTMGLGYSNTNTLWGVCADLLKGIIVLLTPLLPACISAAFSEDP